MSFDAAELTVPKTELEPVLDDPRERLRAGQLANPIAYLLRLQALYLQHAYRYDELAGLSSARIEPALHQVYVAHRVLQKLRPRMILADEVGLGKTIEAGLILKELRARQLVDRVLIVVPASLQYQWLHEMESKFNERFEIIDGQAARFLGRNDRNPWASHDRIICSVNLAARPDHAEKIASIDWDLVIFDEAHRVRRRLEGANNVRTTRAYALADELKELAFGVLLLTATPMQLHPFELYSLIELVEPGLYPSFDAYDRRRAELPELNELMKALMTWRALAPEERRFMARRMERRIRVLMSLPEGTDIETWLANAANRERLADALIEEHPLSQVMVRNRKAEIGGFTTREPVTELVELTDDELALYRDVSEYIRWGYQRAQRTKRYAVGFLMVLFQKMLTSSSAAIRESFKRRVEKLKKQLEEIEEQRSAMPSEEDLEEMRDLEELSIAIEELEQLAADQAHIEHEVRQLESLIDRLGRNRDSKAERLLRIVKRILDHDPDEKVLVFTQFIETQRFLVAALEQNGFTAAAFNGRMSAEEKEHAVKSFRNEAQVLVSTEAGGEGRNFQFCHIVVNYDLPWNPMRLEQRIGRVDRIGQKRNVFIYNLACEETVEERVLEVLHERIGLFRESVGALDPILGEIERDIERIVLEQIDRFEEAFETLGIEVEAKVRQAREKERALADFVLDRASFRRDLANQLLNRKPMATHAELESFVARCLEYYGGRLDPHPDGGWVISLSPRLKARLHARESAIRGVFDPKLALEREELPFFAFGHDLIDRLVQLPTAETAAAGVRITDDAPPGGALEVFYEIQSEAGFSRTGQFIRHVVDANLSVTSEKLTSMPTATARHGRTDVEIPSWLDEAIAASTATFHEELAKEYDETCRRHEALKAQEIERAERVFAYQRERLERMIAEEAAWIAEKEESGNEKERRILPARRGKLRKNEERLRNLTAEHEEKVEQIRQQMPGFAGRPIAAGWVTRDV